MKLQLIEALIRYTRPLIYATKCQLFNNIPHCALNRMVLNRPFALTLGLERNNPFSLSFFSSTSYASNLLSKTYIASSFNTNGLISKRKLHSRNYHNQNDSSEENSKPVLLYVQNPFRWLVNKLDFGMLRRAWDPDFRETDFKDGAKLAISSITQIMSSNKFEDLSGLLTSPAISSLRYEVETKWTDIQRRNVTLNINDIKVALPQRVRFQRIAEKKFCDIDMVFLALKLSKYEGVNATIFMEIKARFHRDYTEGLIPDWTVSMFKVTRFNILPR